MGESACFKNGHARVETRVLKTLVSQRQSIIQKGVHAHPLTARERENWFLQHLSQFLAAKFGRQ